MKKFDRKLILSDGSEYCGYGFGSGLEKITEIVFNTSMVGYQEILSDPSYTYQTVAMAYPLIGNYGMAEDDFETDIPSIGGLAVRDYNNSHLIYAVNIHYRKLWRNIRYWVSMGLIQENWYVPYVILEAERHYSRILAHPCRTDFVNWIYMIFRRMPYRR